MSGPLVVLDATNLARRAYHAGGSGMVLRTAARVREMIPGAQAVAAWDCRPPYWRHELFAEYKAHRLDDPTASAFVKGEGAECRAAGLPGYYAPKMEADDVAATLLARAGGVGWFVTTDQDWTQLLAGGALWLVPCAGGLEQRGESWVWERYGLPSLAWPDFVALKGDASDGLPGAKGIGAKRAAALLRRHGGLDEVLAAEPSLAGQADALRLYRELATMRADADLRPV